MKGTFVPDKQTIPAVTSHMLCHKQQRTRTILFSGVDLLPVAEPFKPFMLTRKESATSVGWNLLGLAIAMSCDLTGCVSGGLMDLFPYSQTQRTPHDIDTLRIILTD